MQVALCVNALDMGDFHITIHLDTTQEICGEGEAYSIADGIAPPYKLVSRIEVRSCARLDFTL
jgi:hypothetical protein